MENEIREAVVLADYQPTDTNREKLKKSEEKARAQNVVFFLERRSELREQDEQSETLSPPSFSEVLEQKTK